MNWLRQVLLNVLIIADFFCATLIVAKIAESVPEGAVSARLLLAIWFVSLIMGAAVIIVIWRRLRSASEPS